ncbi:unnamed protein product [Chrysoparadoxa australica]
MKDLKGAQRDAVVKMLNMNKEPSSTLSNEMSEWSDQWKVLVYDAPCRDIISTLLNVTQLRKRGVTLHMLLEAEREPITEVPAIYFCRPTEENLKRIAQDCANRLYAGLHLNFSCKLERPLMERLAQDTIASGSVDMIKTIHDQHLDFVSMEQHLFTLNQADSFVAYNDPTRTDAEVTGTMSSVTAGLFSTLACLKESPVIRAPPGGAAQMVAEQLYKLVADHHSGSGVFSGAGGSVVHQRPMLVVLDRNIDLVTPLMHTSTYQALLDDVLNYKLNRVSVQLDGKEKGPKAQQKTYDLDPESDEFFRRHKGAPFPEAIEANSSELASVTQQEDAIRRKTGGGGGGGGDAVPAKGGAEEGSGTKDLAAAVESLPELMDQKKGLEMHTNILKSVMDLVAARHVPVYFEAEAELVMTSRADKSAMKQLLGGQKGSVKDKLRLLGIYYLATRAQVRLLWS